MTAAHPEPELLNHLVLEFREYGTRAVEFLETARGLVDAGLEQWPRGPETVAYCLREALKSITSSKDHGEGGEWARLSRSVSEARVRFQRAAELAYGDDVDAA